MGTVFAQVGDPYPTHMYLFVMGIPPKSLVGGWSAYAREAQAKTQASELIQWHLEKLRRESACNSMGASQTGVDAEGGRSSTIERLEAGAAAPAVAGIGSARALSSDRAFGEMGVSAPSMEVSRPYNTVWFGVVKNLVFLVPEQVVHGVLCCGFQLWYPFPIPLFARHVDATQTPKFVGQAASGFVETNASHHHRLQDPATSIALATSCVTTRQIAGPSVSTLIAETQVQLVALPNHWRATVQFDVKVNGLSCRTIPFGTASDDDDDGGIPGSVFGGVPNDFGTQKDISFPHRVVDISGGDGDATDTECRNDPSLPVLHHRGPFTLKNDELFADSWEARAHQNDRCNNRCYNGLHRYGFKRARNILFFVALLMLAMQLIQRFSGGSTVGGVFSGLLAMALFIVLRMEIHFFPGRFAPSTRSSRWVNMPVLSFTVEPAREGLLVDSDRGGSRGPEYIQLV